MPKKITCYNDNFPTTFEEILEDESLIKTLQNSYFKDSYDIPFFVPEIKQGSYGIGNGPEAEVWDRFSELLDIENYNRKFDVHYLNLPAYYFIIYKPSDRQVDGEEIIKNIFSKIDEQKDWKLESKDNLKSSIMNRIAQSAEQALIHSYYKQPDQKLYLTKLEGDIFPCYCLNMELARYISTTTDKRSWANLKDKDDNRFRPKRNFGYEIESKDSFENVRGKIQQMLAKFYTCNGTLFSSISYKCATDERKKNREYIKKVNELIGKCKNVDQIKNLCLCALNIAHDKHYSIFSLEKTTLYQLLLNVLKLTNDFITLSNSEEVRFRHTMKH